MVASNPDKNEKSSIPTADFLVITWTEAETKAIAEVFGEGKYSFDTLKGNNFTPLKFTGIDLPALAPYHGSFFQTKINGKSVVVLKADWHPKKQPALSDKIVRKLLGEGATKHYKNLVSTGTGGGIWDSIDVGDVVVTNNARYGLTLSTAKQALRFTGIHDLVGSNSPEGAPWFDYANKHFIKKDDCVGHELLTAGGREHRSGTPKIIYKATGSEVLAVVTNSHIGNGHINEEKQNLATYKKMGASLDENDTYIAETCKDINFKHWVSIRNVSDVPRSDNTEQYTEYQLCSSINGAYAVWAYIMGH
ncbi:MAG TPA: hypothetical protein DGG95_06140 [Cytophagales bacterium]|nr:hypothetical protein [Cytophagales bacterium]